VTVAIERGPSCKSGQFASCCVQAAPDFLFVAAVFQQLSHEPQIGVRLRPIGRQADMGTEITDPGKPGGVTAWIDQALGGPGWRTLDLGGDKPAGDKRAEPAEIELETG
jgi:hypothetical protein